MGTYNVPRNVKGEGRILFIFSTKSQIQQQLEEKEENMDDIIDEMAKLILEENEQYIGEDVKNIAIEKIEEETKEGGKADGKKTRGRKKKSTTI